MDYLKGWISFCVCFIVGFIYGKVYFKDFEDE